MAAAQNNYISIDKIAELKGLKVTAHLELQSTMKNTLQQANIQSLAIIPHLLLIL